MDWTNLWNTAIQFLQGFSAANKTSTPPSPPTTPGTPQSGADNAVAALQGFINQLARMGAIQIDAPLKVDGWLGPKTDAAILVLIARARTLLGTP